MPLSAILDVLIGMALVFAVLSAAAAAIQEAIAKLLAARSGNLMGALEKTLGASTLDGLERGLATLGVARVRSLWKWAVGGDGRAEYVPRDTLSAHLLALAIPVLEGKKPANELPPALAALVESARGDAANLANAVKIWTDNLLDAASRAYARYAHLSLFAIGLVLCAWFDISAVRLADFLWHNETARAAIVQKASTYAPPATQSSDPVPDIAKQLYANLATELALPLREGPWQAYLPPLVGRPAATAAAPATAPAATGEAKPRPWNIPPFEFPSWLTLFGWFLSAAATVLGAKYWFDTIQNLMRFKPKTA